MISIIHPSRSRPEKSYDTVQKWIETSSGHINKQIIISLDSNDPKLGDYLSLYQGQYTIITNNNRSCVDAINNAAKMANESEYSLMVVVSDDTAPTHNWDIHLLDEVAGKRDYLLKTDDGIQNYIVTMTVMDRKYYERDGFIYHPDFRHQFADTYLTCLADIRGRLLHSNLKFPHLHYSHSGGKETADALHHRNDLTWKDGQDTFIRLMKQFSKADIQKIRDRQMVRFLRNNGVQV